MYILDNWLNLQKVRDLKYKKLKKDLTILYTNTEMICED